MKPRFSYYTLALLAGALFFSSCDKNDDNKTQAEDTYTLSGNASGGQEVPAVTTDATGTLTGRYHTENKALDYTIAWTGLSGNPAAMHFHGPAAAGTNASVMIPITGFTAAPSGTYTGTATLTPAQDSALLEGKLYYNIHTPDHPGGEIRGQVAATHD